SAGAAARRTAPSSTSGPRAEPRKTAIAGRGRPPTRALRRRRSALHAWTTRRTRVYAPALMRLGTRDSMLLGTIAGLSMTGPLQASELRFSATAAGNIVATGNAVGLSKELDANGPGTLDSVGTFASLDPNAVDDAPVN